MIRSGKSREDLIRRRAFKRGYREGFKKSTECLKNLEAQYTIAKDSKTVYTERYRREADQKIKLIKELYTILKASFATQIVDDEDEENELQG